MVSSVRVACPCSSGRHRCHFLTPAGHGPGHGLLLGDLPPPQAVGVVPLHHVAVHRAPALHHGAPQAPGGVNLQAVGLRAADFQGVHHPAHLAFDHLLDQYRHGRLLPHHPHLLPVYQGFRRIETGQDILKGLEEALGRDVEKALVQAGKGEVAILTVGAAAHGPEGLGLFRLAPDFPGHLVGHHSGQDAVLDLPGGVALVRLARGPGLQPPVNPLFQVVVLQEAAPGPGGDDKARRHRQGEVLRNNAQGIGLAPDEFRLIRGRLLEGNHVGQLPGQGQTTPQLRFQGNKDPVDRGVQLQVTVGTDEVDSLNHMQDQVLNLVGGVDEILAVEDVFPSGFLSQVGNQFHDPLVVLQQFLEMLKDLRKGHQVGLGPFDFIPEVLKILPH